MELLKIEKSSARYWNNDTYHDIKEIDRSGLLAILSKIYYEDDVTIIDTQVDTDDIKDPAAKIIFDNILAKLNDFKEKRNELMNEINLMYRDIESQYSEDLKNDG